MSILILSQGDSDLSKVLMRSAKCTLLSFKEAENADLSAFSSIALLCGTEEGIPFTIPAALRIRIDEFAESGNSITEQLENAKKSSMQFSCIQLLPPFGLDLPLKE